MTRVPKFRAWDKIDNEMIPVTEMTWDPIEDDEVEFGGIGDFITWSRLPGEVEIMQSTGLKDKNGVEIFEGDIVTGLDYDLDPLKGEIVFKHGCFLIESDEGDYLVESEGAVEVIGNAYENKELLE